jgi:hypothetical protein
MRAAVQEGPGALESWKCWLEAVDIERADLDVISYRLLPLVYHNLAGQNADHPLLGKLKGIYRQAWLENQLFLQRVVPIIYQLRDREISVILLDDLTSILGLYNGQGVRRLYSLDILVWPPDVAKLLAYFEERKIWAKVGHAERFLAVETPLEVWPPFDLPCSFAWRVHPWIRTQEEASAAWRHAVPAVLGRCPVLTLGLEDHFLRSCLRGIGGNAEPAFFSLIDVAWMLRAQAGDIDRERLVELARSNHQALPASECLQSIAADLDMPAAKELLERLRELPVSWADHLEHRWVSQNRPHPGLLILIGRRLLLYRRSIKIPGPFGFLRYLQFAWGGGRLLCLPGLALHHFRSALARREQIQ